MRYVFVLFALMAVGLGCKNPGQVAADEKTNEAASEADSIAKDFAKGSEAKAWLADANHIFFKVSKDSVTALTTSMYAAGAQEVRVGSQDTINDDEMPALKGKTFGGSLVVQFPKDPAKRKAVFDAIHKQETDVGEDPTKDTGQGYYSFSLD